MPTRAANLGITSKRLGFVGERLGYMLHRTDMLHMEMIRGELAVIGLTPARATALAFVRENPDCPQSELGRALGINRASCMELVKRLVSMNAIERRGGDDRRTQALSLTEYGTELCAQFVAIADDVDLAITRAMSDKDQATLTALLARVRDNLTTHRLTDKSAQSPTHDIIYSPEEEINA